MRHRQDHPFHLVGKVDGEGLQDLCPCLGVPSNASDIREAYEGWVVDLQEPGQTVEQAVAAAIEPLGKRLAQESLGMATRRPILGTWVGPVGLRPRQVYTVADVYQRLQVYDCIHGTSDIGGRAASELRNFGTC